MKKKFENVVGKIVAIFSDFNMLVVNIKQPLCQSRADSRLAPGQWETSLQSNAVSHWLGANLESALPVYFVVSTLITLMPMYQLYTAYKILKINIFLYEK